MSEPLVEARSLVKRYPLPRRGLFSPREHVAAVDGVSLRIESGRNFGLLGESGSGKSTLARLLMGLEPPSSGGVRIMGQDLHRLSAAEMRRLRRHIQMVFQDPYSSLDPRQKVGRSIAEPLHVFGGKRAEHRDAVAQALRSVGLSPDDAKKYPHAFSGGQRQRIAIARALITRPRLIVADEPLSALDVSVQAQVLNLLQDLGREHGVTVMLISHDLAVVDHACDEVAVMYRGIIVEQGSPQVLFDRPSHPYTQMLLASVPPLEAKAPGSAPAAALTNSVPGGCRFVDRCPLAEPLCRERQPDLREVASGHSAACHRAEEAGQAWA